ncbi:tetratricopeptide repeat protein [Clostridium autoethanogenum]|uniref:Tetratricopeptide repeat protein n=1 Tax=Clostridium autoethanogenum DSM 10061 TaxID=1341692 RepID=A0ABN4BCQ4_9CLOT|nr:hypothetical protein [Clostridium autoethanogenum]AGY75329.1 hypothetical protein CAETHG_1104 [Clostridium autoethanogenum DSM 10061]ALU35494.1 Hypothetical protein CLAU_1065 [Clostridium autoethanogenum DSM 10061]OVY52444.1 hypothetical protein WX72_01343 [Clostridium autoethanogenum]
MKKIRNILMILLILIICFCISAFGMYKYSKYKNDITMQKEKALATVQNIQKENDKNAEINKDIQFASNSAKNSKYDDANKYLDEALKLDPNNSEAKNLKDSYSKIIEQQKQQANTETQLQAQKQQAQATSSNNSDNTTKRITAREAHTIACSVSPDFDVALEGVAIDKSMLPRNIVNNYYVFYSETRSDHSANDYAICVNKTTGNIILLNPDGTIRPMSEK